MKKVIVMFVAIAMAIGAQAAAANWQVSAANIYNGAGESAGRWTGSGYIYALTETMTQDTIWNTFSAGGDISANAIQTVSVGNGTINATANVFSYGEQGGGSYSYFIVLVDGDNILLSKTVTATANGTATNKGLAFGNFLNTSQALPTSGSYTQGAWATAGGSGGDIPEPTSGLLLLLGVAGLALRRRSV